MNRRTISTLAALTLLAAPATACSTSADTAAPAEQTATTASAGTPNPTAFIDLLDTVSMDFDAAKDLETLVGRSDASLVGRFVSAEPGPTWEQAGLTTTDVIVRFAVNRVLDGDPTISGSTIQLYVSGGGPITADSIRAVLPRGLALITVHEASAGFKMWPDDATVQSYGALDKRDRFFELDPQGLIVAAPAGEPVAALRAGTSPWIRGADSFENITSRFNQAGSAKAERSKGRVPTTSAPA